MKNTTFLLKRSVLFWAPFLWKRTEGYFEDKHHMCACTYLLRSNRSYWLCNLMYNVSWPTLFLLTSFGVLQLISKLSKFSSHNKEQCPHSSWKPDVMTSSTEINFKFSNQSFSQSTFNSESHQTSYMRLFSNFSNTPWDNRNRDWGQLLYTWPWYHTPFNVTKLDKVGLLNFHWGLLYS